MTDFNHIRLVGTERSYSYTAPGGGGGEYSRPARDRAEHAQKLARDLESADVAAIQRGLLKDDAIPLSYDLQPDALELVQSLEQLRSGIQLLNVVTADTGVRATVRVPANKRRLLDAVIRRYATELNSVSNRPKHQDLVENIDAIRLATERELWTDTLSFPKPGDQIWWEVWLHHDGAQPPEQTHERFRAAAAHAGLQVKPRRVTFPERVVVLAFGSYLDWERSPRLFLMVAELRKAKELPTDYVELPPRFQGAVLSDLIGRLQPPPPMAPAVCLLDTGVAQGHPLISPALDPADAQAVDPAWGTADDHEGRHGTTQAGIALHGPDLAQALASSEPVVLIHRLESVKLLPRQGNGDPDSYGNLTQEAVARAESVAPERRRAACLALTADARDGGLPSSWSASLDQLCFGGEVFGEPKLLVVAAGNLRDEIVSPGYEYFNLSGPLAGVEDPAQSWNALTVGAATDRVMIQHVDYCDYQPVASAGDLSPTSRTSLAWPEDARQGWPLKPDVVMEGGNWATTPGGDLAAIDDLGLLTTTMHPTGSLLTVTRDTSPAAAAGARLAAQLWAIYPALWPETVRGLIVHSARWTPAMCRRFPGKTKGNIQQRLRCYGYGVPDLRRAAYSSENAATLWFEGALTPYRIEGSSIKSNEMHVHELPWPVEVLQGLGAETIRMRVTLSYFVEPSPGRCGWTRRHRYASHGLRFDLQRKTETLDAFLGRISDTAADEGPVDEPLGAALPWLVGQHGRSQGSIHSDMWEGTAAELAGCRSLAVFPVTGWWRERKHLDRWGQRARYSLIVTLESESSDIYTPIANVVGIPIAIRS